MSIKSLDVFEPTGGIKECRKAASKQCQQQKCKPHSSMGKKGGTRRSTGRVLDMNPCPVLQAHQATTCSQCWFYIPPLLSSALVDAVSRIKYRIHPSTNDAISHQADDPKNTDDRHDRPKCFHLDMTVAECLRN